MSKPAIPDPFEPTKRALHGETGEVLSPLHMLPIVKGMAAPTLSELLASKPVGWFSQDAIRFGRDDEDKH